ncbi:LPS O-antigen chain length determinant protein WzzB [Pseudomonas sp. BGI-2]|uniref:LPS O-antigen chain length determinant protein WzzB n=1 Tax=Pseudomonas sp. BGI-2 TaxID=2528211 RepID=UPI00103320C2|nr:Wzz/FepE/Etk N-terminal domain-containing protein [Pseudomonas sp. BGI-2]TBN43357.1 chain length determinant protein [Pseudomonas sp. BGI-2]
MQNNNGDERSSEVDLLELLKVLWVQKWLVFWVAFSFAFVAALYAYITTPVYEAKYYISPPSLNDIANLNYGRTRESGLGSFTVVDVYKVFLSNLQSEDLRQSFFRKYYSPELKLSDGDKLPGNIYDEFSRSLNIAPVGKELNERWSVSIQGENPEKITEWASLYVSYAGQRAEREVVNSAIKEAAVLARNMQLEITSLQESGKKVREDATNQLKEALAVAKASGIENSVTFTGESSSKLAGNMSGDFAYMRGSKALEAELKNIESRQSNDSFIKGLRELQAKYSFYKGLEASEYKVSVFRQDGLVAQPTAPVKPKKILIILLGLLAGIFVGCVVVLMRSFLKKHNANGI